MQLAGKKDYAELHRWSVERSEEFWALLWQFAGVRGTQGARRLVDGDRMPGAKWFPDARLNFAENLLRARDDSLAIAFWGEEEVKRRLTRSELHDLVSRLAQALRAAGVAKGDRVAAYLPNMPEATAAAITPEGWLRTGDQALVDDAGNVRITGRIKDLIIRGGENIAPAEVEDVLRQHPAVADVAVYAVASEFFGEDVAAAVRVRPGMSIDAADVLRFCDGRLAKFKIPRHVRVVESFPMTASGKIQKFRLRERHEAERASAPPQGQASARTG